MKRREFLLGLGAAGILGVAGQGLARGEGGRTREAEEMSKEFRREMLAKDLSKNLGLVLKTQDMSGYISDNITAGEIAALEKFLEEHGKRYQKFSPQEAEKAIKEVALKTAKDWRDCETDDLNLQITGEIVFLLSTTGAELKRIALADPKMLELLKRCREKLKTERKECEEKMSARGESDHDTNLALQYEFELIMDAIDKLKFLEK